MGSNFPCEGEEGGSFPEGNSPEAIFWGAFFPRAFFLDQLDYFRYVLMFLLTD